MRSRCGWDGLAGDACRGRATTGARLGRTGGSGGDFDVFGADGSELDAAVPGRAAGSCAVAWIQPALNSSSVWGGARGGAMGGG